MLIKPTSGGGGVMFQVVSGVSVLVDGVPRWLEPNSVALRSQFPLPIMPFEFQMFEPSSKSPGATSDKVHRRLELDSINSIHPPMSPYSRLLHPSSCPSGRDRPEITTTHPPKPSLTPSPPLFPAWAQFEMTRANPFVSSLTLVQKQWSPSQSDTNPSSQSVV